MKQNQQTTRTHIVVANMIKFGLPLGVVLSLARVIGHLVFSGVPIDSDFVFITCGIFVMGVLFGAVLGLIRK